MTEQMDQIRAIYARVEAGEISNEKGINLALELMKELPPAKQFTLFTELFLEATKRRMNSPLEHTVLIDDSVASPEEVSLWNAMKPFDGFSVAIGEPEIKNPDVLAVWKTYKDKPILRGWNNPMQSVFLIAQDTIYLTDAETVKEYNGDDNERYSVLFHEMIHSTGVSKRLGRSTMKKAMIDGDRNQTLEEMVADVGRLMLMDYVGLLTPKVWDNVNQHSLVYAKRFLDIEKRNIMQVRREALPYAKAAVEYITGKPFVGRLGKYVRGSDEKLLEAA